MDEQQVQTKTLSKSKTKMAVAVGFLGLAALAAGFAGLKIKGQKPDLAFNGAGTNVVQTVDGEFNRFSYTMKNFGSGTNATPFQLNIKLGDGTSANSVKKVRFWKFIYSTLNEPVGNYQVMNSDDGSFTLPLNNIVLAPGAENRVFYWFVLPSTYTASDLKVQYTVDYSNYVAESNENNNYMSQLFNIANSGLAFEESSNGYWCLNLKEQCYSSSPGDTSCDGMIFSSEQSCLDAGATYDWSPKEGTKGTYYELVTSTSNGLSCINNLDCGVGGGCGPCANGQQECSFSTGSCLTSGTCQVNTTVQACESEYWCLNYKEQCLLSSPAGISPIDGSANCQGKEGGNIYSSEESCQQAGATFDWVLTQSSNGNQYQLVTSTTAIFCSSNDDCGVGGGCSECVNGKQDCSSSSGQCLSTGVCEVTNFSQACTSI